MWPYILLILSPILVQHLRIKPASIGMTSDEKNYAAMKLFWGGMFVLLILRHQEVGRDLYTYEKIFIMISENDWQYTLTRSTEVANNVLNKLISLFTDNFRWVMIISAVASVFFVYKTYLRQVADASLSIVLFINMSNFVFLFSGLRQSIAIALGFLAFEFVRKRKFGYYLIVVVLAIFFHNSAFMLFFMYPLYHLRITKKWLIWVVPALGLLFIFNRQIFDALTFLLSLFTKYEAKISSTGAYTMLILFALFAVFSYLIPEEARMDEDAIGMRNFLLLSVVLQMFAPLHNIAMRMNYYYIAFIPLLIPKIIKYRSVRWNQIATFARHVMVIFFLIYFFLSAPQDNVLDTFPYKFLWEK